MNRFYVQTVSMVMFSKRSELLTQFPYGPTSLVHTVPYGPILSFLLNLLPLDFHSLLILVYPIMQKKASYLK